MPLGVAQVGCVTLTSGVLGALGTAFTVTSLLAVQVLSDVLRTVTVYFAGVKPFLEVATPKPVPKLYSTPLGGLFTFIVPDGVAQVGCVTLKSGAVGGGGAAFTIAPVLDVHPLELSFT